MSKEKKSPAEITGPDGDETTVEHLQKKLVYEEIMHDLAKAQLGRLDTFMASQKASIEKLNEQIAKLQAQNSHLRSELEKSQSRPSAKTASNRMSEAWSSPSNSRGFGWAGKVNNDPSDPNNKIAQIQSQMRDEDRAFFERKAADDKAERERMLERGKDRIEAQKIRNDIRHQEYMLDQEYLRFISNTGITNIDKETWLTLRGMSMLSRHGNFS